jgi:tetratricopeptide (TPR) repeat protein
MGITAGLLIALGGWQTHVALNLPRFDTDRFGIAVARFGEGANLQGTALTADITDQLLRGIDGTVRQDSTWRETVEVLPTGLIANADEAEERGRELNADLVIWGQVVQGGDGLVAVNFEVVDTAAHLTGPSLPFVLPANNRFAISELNMPLAPAEVKALVADQGAIITAFSLGLAAYFERDPNTAAIQFAAVEELIEPEASNSNPTTDTRLTLVYFYLGRALQHLGDIEAGRNYLEKAAERNPDDPAIPLSIAYGYSSLEQKNRAHELANDAIHLADMWLHRDPQNEAVAYTRGLAYMLREEHQRALDAFDWLIERHPDFYIAYLSAAQAHLSLDMPEQAIGLLERAIAQSEQLGTDSSWGYLLLAEVHRETGQVYEAEQYFQQALVLAPDVDWMHYRYGFFLDSQGQTKSAEAAYEQMLAVTRNELWALAQIATFYRNHNRIAESIALYEEVVEQRPTDVFSRAYLAELYMETGQVDQARAVFEAVLEEYDTFQYGYASYGLTLIILQDYDLAIEQLKTAVALDPTDGASYYNLALAFAANGQDEQAQEIFRDILAADADVYDPEIRERAREQLALSEPFPTVLPTPSAEAPVPSTPEAVSVPTPIPPLRPATPTPAPMPTPGLDL